MDRVTYPAAYEVENVEPLTAADERELREIVPLNLAAVAHAILWMEDTFSQEAADFTAPDVVRRYRAYVPPEDCE